MTKKYSTARFWAISSIGYGKGSDADEARENYVQAQLRNYAASNTVFKTKPKWEEALRTGEAKAQIWEAPEGATGFVIGIGGLHWQMEDGRSVDADVSQRRELPKAKLQQKDLEGERKEFCSACGSNVSWHLDYVREHGLCVS